MAIALVGSLGAAVTGTTTAAPSFGQSPTAGNLLVAWYVTSSSNLPSTPSGWTQLGSATSGTLTATAFYKAAAGGDTAPSWSDAGATFIAAALGEFSGANTTGTAADRNFATSSVTSAAVATAAGVDAASGELILGMTIITYSMSATKTTSHAYNNGATTQAAASWNNDGTSTATHFRLSYGITTGNASADTLTVTFTTTNISAHESVGQSMKVAVLTKSPPFGNGPRRRGVVRTRV